MSVISEPQAAAVRVAFEDGGEFSAAVEVRRLFPSITGNAEARARARTIAGRPPLASLPPATVTQLRVRTDRAGD